MPGDQHFRTERDAHTTTAIHPRLRILAGGEIALGPGKARLLQGIDGEGSLAGAAKALGMSYMRAWRLVHTMNDCFREPLVELSRGGREQGGATLTATGRRVLELYREMERRCLEATLESWTELQNLLARDAPGE
jgi:molybdate transport system regulatory protein